MNVMEAVRVALMGLVGNKVRSFLTMLGVIIGVAAVIIVVAIGNGMKKDTLERIESMGTNLLTVVPGAMRGARGVATEDIKDLKWDDAEAIRQEVQGVAHIAPEVNTTTQVKYRSVNQRTRIIGTVPEYQLARNQKIALGRFFTDVEVRGRQRVCVLGSVTADNLFMGRPVIGEWIRIQGIPFEVVGVLEEVGGMGGGGRFGNPDDQIIAPLTTIQQRFIGSDRLNSINISAVSSDMVDRVERGVELLLRRRHRLLTGQENDFSIIKQSMFLSSLTEASETMTKLLGGIALVSLLVGGVGIMNIMLVSVTERTREIGVRKAIGARKRDIMAQFLIESVTLSVIGGGIGVALGVGVSQLIEKNTGWSTVVSPTSIVQAFIFAAAVGIFFGLWPAKKAADMDPITALRYE